MDLPEIDTVTFMALQRAGFNDRLFLSDQTYGPVDCGRFTTITFAKQEKSF